MEALILSITAEGPAAKRPPQMALAFFFNFGRDGLPLMNELRVGTCDTAFQY
jgi:hypothetical protein